MCVGVVIGIERFVICFSVFSDTYFCFFFFKLKTAYEMRISDWSSDVCSSDLDDLRSVGADQFRRAGRHPFRAFGGFAHHQHRLAERGRFLLHAAAVGQDEMAEVQQADEMGIIQRSEEHTSELQSLMRISYAVFCLKKKKNYQKQIIKKQP